MRRRKRPPQAKKAPSRKGQAERKESLVERMGLHAGHTLCLINPPEGAYARFSNELPEGSHLYLGLPPRAPAHLFVLWPDGSRSLESSLSYLKSMLDPEGTIWVVIPRRKTARGGGSDVTPTELNGAAQSVGLVSGERVAFSSSRYAVGLKFGGPDKKRRRGR